jgi:hypothetical protein
MTTDRERLTTKIRQDPTKVLVVSRRLAAGYPHGRGRARLVQLAEYTELVIEACEASRTRPPAFAGRMDDEPLAC